ncbi:cation acetate symporter [Candidatus Chlorohelix sp.]|uniref:solute symporter family protein n=1 Tax=Candidatus Chlorohelix sp. TaxID=3139201 RepID=UPI0030477D3C
MPHSSINFQVFKQLEGDKTPAIAIFLAFVLVTLGITFWASRRTKSAAEFYAAGRKISAWQNGVAVAGDYMSAASFLGIAGIIAFSGFDGFMYSVGWLVAYLTVLLVVAEPLRNGGKYTMADILAYRLKAKPVRAAAAFSTITVSTFYMIAQMVGAGTLVKLLFGWDFETAVVIVGILMIVYVVFGGMLATTWVQIIKALLLMAGTIVLSIIVLANFNFNIGNFFDEITRIRTGALIAEVPAGSNTVELSAIPSKNADGKFNDITVGGVTQAQETVGVAAVTYKLALANPLAAAVTKDTKVKQADKEFTIAADATAGDKALVFTAAPTINKDITVGSETVKGSKITYVTALAAPLKNTYVKNTNAGTPVDFSKPGYKYKDDPTNNVYGKLDLISLGLALIFGTAGLPHILVRFYTVPTARAARVSVIWAMLIIGFFYMMTTFLGFGAAMLVTGPNITLNGGSNMSAPLLAQAVGGTIFFALISAVAFATILAVVAGLTISASSAIAHDFWQNIVRNGQGTEKEQVTVARITAFVVGAISIFLAIFMKTANVAYLVGLAFAVAASANLPVVVYSLFWKRFNTVGAVTGIVVGLASSLILILIGPNGFAAKDSVTNFKDAIFPLENPGIISIPLGFLAAFVGSLFTRETAAEAKFAEMYFRTSTGVGAE